MTGDEEGSEEEIPEIQPPLPMPAAIPDLPVPGVDLEGEIPEDKEAQTDDLLEVQPPMPTSAVIPVDEFIGPQDLVVQRVSLLKHLL